MLCMIPGITSVPDGCNAGPADSERMEMSRRKAIRVYFAISIVQVMTGLTVFACSAISVHYHSGGGFPFFSGSFVIGSVLLMLSMLAFRVYNKGPLFTTCDLSRKEVLCALNWHRCISFLAFFVCVFGLAIIWMYGLCIMDETECSYDDHVQTNKTLAIIVFVLGCVGLITAAIGVVLTRKYGDAFGIQIVQGQRGGLRYVGVNDDVISELRRQNAEMHRQLSGQTNYPHMPPGCQGFTNYGFEPPSPPPYSPSGVEVSVTGGSAQIGQMSQTLATTSFAISGNPPKYSEIEPSVIPSEPPPAYKETSGDDDDLRNDETTNL